MHIIKHSTHNYHAKKKKKLHFYRLFVNAQWIIQNKFVPVLKKSEM